MIMFAPQNSSRDSRELSQQGTGCSSKNRQRLIWSLPGTRLQPASLTSVSTAQIYIFSKEELGQTGMRCLTLFVVQKHQSSHIVSPVAPSSSSPPNKHKI